MPPVKPLVDSASDMSGKVSFHDLVKETTGHEVFKLNIVDTPEDKTLFDALEKAAKNFINSGNRTGQRYHGNRINDVGKRIEEVFVEELKKTKLIPKQLKTSGYPDIKVCDASGRVTYLESKAVSKDWESTLRSFYYKNGSKIDSDARHLLIAWNIEEERDKYWKVTGYKFCDLFNLAQMGVKLEFNSNNKVLYNADMVLSGYNLKN